MKKIIFMMLFASVNAYAEFSANIGATSNYVWRGVTQTDDSAAVQGGVDYSHASGFYIGTWASNIDWGGADNKGTEVDVYLGLAKELGDFSYDAGANRYIYPDSNHKDADFTEIYAKLGYKNVSGGIAYTVDGDAADDEVFSKGDLYYHLGLDFDLNKKWGLGFVLGHYDFDTPNNSSDYAHGRVNLTRKTENHGDFTFSISIAEEESGSDDALVFVSWNKTF